MIAIIFSFHKTNHEFLRITLYNNKIMMNKKKRQGILDKYELKLIKENKDGSINVKGVIAIRGKTRPRTKIPDDIRSLNINILQGSLACEYNKFTSFEGAPKIITNALWCSGTTFTLKSLANLPKIKGHIMGGDGNSTFKGVIDPNSQEKHPGLLAYQRMVTINNIINS
jgi:hypothetical protein